MLLLLIDGKGMFSARFDFLTHRHSPDMRGRRIHFEVKGCPDINVETEEVIISSQFMYMSLVEQCCRVQKLFVNLSLNRECGTAVPTQRTPCVDLHI